MIFTKYDRGMESMVEKAIVIVAKAFEGRRGVDGTPMVHHSLRVGMAGQNERQMVLGYLHDVMEDTAIMASYLEEVLIPQDIIDDLEILTHRYGFTYQEYINNIELRGSQDVLAVKLNDLIDNIRRDDPKEHYSRYAKHMRAYKILVKVYEDSYGTFPGKIQEGNI